MKSVNFNFLANIVIVVFLRNDRCSKRTAVWESSEQLQNVDVVAGNDSTKCTTAIFVFCLTGQFFQSDSRFGRVPASELWYLLERHRMSLSQ